MSLQSNDEIPWYVPDRNPTKDRLTFGVEIEISVAFLENEEMIDHHPDDKRPVRGILLGGTKGNLFENGREHIALKLIEAGIAAEVVPESGVQAYKLQNPRAWVIKADDAVAAKPPDGGQGLYSYNPVELVTPPMYYSAEAIQEVKFVMTLLSNTYRCGTVTGLHVHVGNCEKGFPPAVIQSLLATYWAFENHIELIHPRFRWDYAMCPSLRRWSELATTVLQPDSPTLVEDGIEMLLDPENSDLKLLFEATSPNSDLFGIDYATAARSAINIKPLVTEDKGNTVEFRQHAMTLDPVETEHWIRFCVGLVEFADTVSKPPLERFLEDCVHQSPDELSIKDLFEMLGIPREGEYFAKADGIKYDQRG